jgi:hypothetical protein
MTYEPGYRNLNLLKKANEPVVINLAFRLDYISQLESSEFSLLRDEANKLLNGFVKSVQKNYLSHVAN